LKRTRRRSCRRRGVAGIGEGLDVAREEGVETVATLRAKYPYLFAGRHLGREFPSGWLEILARLYAAIDAALTPEERACVRIEQQKEKWGGLRVYLNVAPPRVDIMSNRGLLASGEAGPPGHAALHVRLAPLVAAAEAASYQTCYCCGAPGRVRPDRSWVLTLCDRHADAYR
jgi:hypothetical protein